MYVEPNFRTKKELKQALREGRKVGVFSVGPFPAALDGRVSVEGPHYPEPHRWYAQVEVRDGSVVRVTG